MRRIVIAGIASASILIAGCGSGQTSIIKQFPYCHPSLDLCLQGMGINSLSNGTIAAYVRVKTQSEPKAFEAFARLYTRSRGKWIELDTKKWGINKLPAVGHTTNLLPDLVSFCFTGPWMMTIHVISISSTDISQSVYYFYPGYKKAKGKQIHSFLASTKDLPQRKWPWINIGHCT